MGESLASQTKLHGFPTVRNFLAEAPDVCNLHWRGNSCLVRGVSNQGTKHVVEMVSKQHEKRQQGKGRGRHLGLLNIRCPSLESQPQLSNCLRGAGESFGLNEDFTNNEKKQQEKGRGGHLDLLQIGRARSAKPCAERMGEDSGKINLRRSERENMDNKDDFNNNEKSKEVDGKMDSEENNNSISDEAQGEEGLDELVNRVKEIVLSESKISETSLRQKLRDTGTNMLAVDLTKLLFKMSEAGVVELEKVGFGNKGICVSPSLRTLREAKAGEGPEQMIALAICKTIPTQLLPGHLKEGNNISVVVTEVKSPGRFWFNLHEFTQTPVYFDAVQLLMDRMQKFYAEEGDRWRVESVIDCLPGAVLAAQYSEGKVKQGFHRVIVKQQVSLKRLKLFYIDHGTTAEQKLKHVRFLPAEFGQLPGQALEAQLWGVEQVGEGSRWPSAATRKFLKLVREAEEGSLVAIIMEGVTRRRSKVERNTNLLKIHHGLSLRLDRIDLGPKGTNIAKALVAEGLAKWEDDVKSEGKSDASVTPLTPVTTAAASAATTDSGYPPDLDNLDAGELKLREESVKAKLDKLCIGLGVRKMKLSMENT